MKYIIIDSSFINLSSFQKQLVQLFVELDEKGIVNREIGVDSNDIIIHIFPSKDYLYGKYGIFDLNSFDFYKLSNDLSCEEFESKWKTIFH